MTDTLTLDMPAADTTAKPAFLYDDCCPLCRGYTATFSLLGWADRTAFSTVDDQVLDALDTDAARHHIPLHDKTTGTTQYGLDGIMSVVAAEVPLLGAIGNQRLIRRALDGLYWFITYNRRHIIAAPPPRQGFDCAPDFNPAAVRSYVGFCAVGGCALGALAGPVPVAAATAAGAALVAGRDDSWEINDLQAAGHVGSVAVAAGLAGAAATLLTRRPAVAALAVAATAARKIHARRWMRIPR